MSEYNVNPTSHLDAVTLTYDPLRGPPLPESDGWRVGCHVQDRGTGETGVLCLVQPQRLTVVWFSGKVETWIPNELIKYAAHLGYEAI